MTKALLVLLLLAALPAAAGERFDSAPLTIETRDGRSLPFTVELAVSPAQRQQGLMFREALAPDAGMLFLYPRSGMIQMWMRNTLIPLDMLFLAPDGLVVATADNAVPLSEAIIAPGVPARAVLELPGDAIERLHLRPGDRVVYPGLDGD